MTKKKKKPAVNPARGFMTTSVASKKPVPEDDINEKEPEVGNNVATPAQENGAQKSAAEKDLHELTPEELEARLELNDLQSFIESQGPKTARDSQRQVSKLQTDCRVVRPQSFSINSFRWLPEEILEEILAFAREEQANITAAPLPKDVTEDDWTSRFWTLMRTLLGIGISKEKVLELLKQIQLKDLPSDTNSYIWGLQECFDRLAQESNQLGLPLYDFQRNKLPTESFENSDASRPPSGAVTPMKQPKKSDAIRPPDIIQVLDVEDFDVSDVDSDADGDEMMSVYMAAKARLFAIHPDLAGVDTPTKKSRKVRQPTISSNSPSVRKIQDKIRRIESDLLFDKERAMEKWSLERIQLTREAINSRKPLSGGSSGSSGEENSREKPTTKTFNHSADSDNEGLGDMFAIPNEKHDSPVEGTTESLVVLRNFGKITGMTPRRLLEDACRAR
jgi:ATP-dependent RNA helicase DHX29